MLLESSNRPERIAYLSYMFASGRTFTTSEAANMLHVSVRTIQRDFQVISRVVPIFSFDGRWTTVENMESSLNPLISPY